MPPTISYALLCAASLVLLVTSGFGPSLHLVSQRTSHRVWTALLISPVVALAEIGLILYPLFLNNIPVDRVAIPLTVVLLTLSGSLVLVDVRAHSGDYKILLSRETGAYLLGLVVIFLMLVLPAYFGGDHYRYWQTNAYDATNYWSLTYFVAHIPIREIGDPSALQTALQVNPALIMPLTHEPVRLVVELPFAWLSLLFSIPVYEFYYYFKLLALAATFLVALAVARQLKLPAVYHFVLAAVLSVGFWAWYISDIDALSHSYSIPLGLFFLFAWLQLERDAPLNLFSRQRFLFSVSLAALLGYYPEFIPLTLVAILLYYGKLALDYPMQSNLKRMSGLLATIGMTALLVMPSLNRMLQDLIGQSSTATTTRTDAWASGFYAWLYTRDMLAGRLWGLLFYSGEQPFRILATTALGGAAGYIVLVGVLRNILDRQAPPRIRIAIALTVSFWGGALILHVLGRDWVAGKAFAMGAAFVLTTLFVFAHQLISTRTIRVGVRYFVVASFAIWIATQLLIPVLRMAYFAAGAGFGNGYVGVQSPIGDIVPEMDYLRQHPPELLVSYFPEIPRTTSVGWEMMLSDQFQHFTLGGLTNYYDQTPVQFWQRIDEAPSHLLFDSAANYLQALGIGTLIPVDNTPFQLYAVTPQELDESVFRSDFLTSDRETGFVTAFLDPATGDLGAYRALASNEGRVRFLGGSTTPIGILLSYQTPAPGSISLQFDDEPVSDEAAVEPDGIQYIGLCTAMRPGANDLIIHYTSTDDVATSPLKIYHFQVMPTDDFRVDIGALDDGIDISDGWYYPETGSDFDFRWAAKTASMTLLTCQKSDHALRFRAFPIGNAQAVTLSVNGHEVGKVELRDGLQEYEIQIPAEVLNPDGLQTFTFNHTYDVTPTHDSRQLAVFYDWIELHSNS